EEINVTRPLRVEEDRQSRIEEPLIAREDQSRRRLIEVIRFKIDKSAQLHLQLQFRIAKQERVVDAVEQIRARVADKRERENKDEFVRPHGATCRSSAAGHRP